MRNIMKHPYVSEKKEHAGGWLFQNGSNMLDHLAGLVVLNCLTDVFQYVFPKTELQNKRNYFPDRWWSRSIFISMVALWMGKCHALNTILFKEKHNQLVCILAIRSFLIGEISQLWLVSDVVQRFNGYTLGSQGFQEVHKMVILNFWFSLNPMFRNWEPANVANVRTGEPSDEDSTQHLDRNH